MKLTACPTCHRSATWSAKWQTCSACATVSVVGPDVLGPNETWEVTRHDDGAITSRVLQNVPRETIRNAEPDISVTQFVQRPKQPKGRPRKYATDADRQRAYRSRKVSA